jgi:1-acyl-sn-glycerol-3-phosphate acyltransferase
VNPFYHIETFIVKVLLLLFTRWRVYGRHHVPRQGGLIVVCNHLNNVDPPILSASIPRRIVFMAKEELYKGWGITPLLTRSFGALPVRRGEVDRKALRRACQALEQGLALGMFPEGTRSHKAQMQSAQLGTAWVALEAGVPILPVAIWGTEAIHGIWDVLSRPTITVNIGQPFLIPVLAKQSRRKRERLTQATELIMSRLAALLPEAYRGVYSQHRVDLPAPVPVDGASPAARAKGD